MVNYLEVLEHWMKQPHYLLVILIIVYFGAATIDFLAGSINALVTSRVTFSSRKSQIGIIRKLLTLSVMILVVPLALMLPFDLAIWSLTALYSGICFSEIYSILGHIGIVKDGDKHRNMLGSLFNSFIDKIYNNNKLDK